MCGMKGMNDRNESARAAWKTWNQPDGWADYEKIEKTVEISKEKRYNSKGSFDGPNAGIAQSVEHFTRNEGVVSKGSSVQVWFPALEMPLDA